MQHACVTVSVVGKLLALLNGLSCSGSLKVVGIHWPTWTSKMHCLKGRHLKAWMKGDIDQRNRLTKAQIDPG